MSFVTHTPQPELYRCPAFTRVPTSLERGQNSVPELPEQRTLSGHVLKRLQDLEPYAAFDCASQAISVRPQYVSIYSRYSSLVLDANSPYRRSNQFKSQMPLPKTLQPSGRVFCSKINDSLKDSQGDDFEIGHSHYDDYPCERAAPRSAGNVYYLAPEIERSAQRWTRQELANKYTGQGDINLFARYGISPARTGRAVVKSKICDFDENTYQSIPFSGSIRADRYMRKNGIRPLRRAERAASPYSRLCNAQLSGSFD